MPCLLYHRKITIRKSFLTVFRDFSQNTGSALFLRNAMVQKKRGYLPFLFSDINLAIFLLDAVCTCNSEQVLSKSVFQKIPKEKTRDSVYGSLISGTDKTTGIVDFAMIGSAYHKGRFFENIDSYGMVICDECHHIGSGQGQALMSRIRAKYIYGLSATPERSDHLDDIVYMLLGPVRHKYSVREQADVWGIDRYVYPRFTRVVNISGGPLDIHKADDLIADSSVRNEQIVSDVEQALASGRTPVILTKLKRHAETLHALLKDKADHVFFDIWKPIG